MNTRSAAKKKTCGNILPSDPELYIRARHFSQIMEKYKVDDNSEICDVDEIESLLIKYGEKDVSEEEDVSDLGFESKDEIEKEHKNEGDGNDDNDSSLSFKKVLNETLKVVEERKKVWKEAGIDDVMKSFCLEEIDNKVGTWLQKYVQNVENLEDNSNNNRCSSNNNSNLTAIIEETARRNYDLYQNHRLLQRQQQQQKLKQQQLLLKKRQLRKRNCEIYDNDDYNDNNNEDSSIESVDTAKYILSNRKPYKTKTDTMTIKRFRNIRDHHERDKSLLYIRNAKLSNNRNDSYHRMSSYSMLINNNDFTFNEDTSDESSFDDTEIHNCKRSTHRKYNKHLIRHERLRDDRSYRNNGRNYEFQRPPKFKNGEFSRKDIQKLMKKKKRQREIQLKELSILASARRTPSPQPSSFESEESEEESEYNTVLQKIEFTNKKNESNNYNKDRNLMKINSNKSTIENKKLQISSHRSINTSQSQKSNYRPLSGNSTISSFHPKINSTSISSNGVHDCSKIDKTNKSHISVNKDKDKNTLIRTHHNNSNNETPTSTHSTNKTDITMIYSPGMNLSSKSQNTTGNSTIKSGKLRLTKEILENSLGEKGTENLLKHKKDILNYEMNADSKIFFIKPQSESDSDDDPLASWKPKTPEIIEITADGEKNFL